MRRGPTGGRGGPWVGVAALVLTTLVPGGQGPTATAAPSAATPPPVAAAGNPEAPPQRDRGRMVRALLELRAEDMQGRTWTHDDLEGRVVLLDFWATWCAPCLRELPNLKELWAHHDRDEFLILGISLDAMSRRDLRSWLNRHGVDWPQIHQDAAYDDRIPVAFGIDRLPTSLLLDRDGRVRAFDLRGEALVRAVNELVDG